MPVLTGPVFQHGLAKTLASSSDHGHMPNEHRMDNQKSIEIYEFLTKDLNHGVQYYPSRVHRANLAERHVQTTKAHLTSILSTCHPEFPKQLYDRLLLLAEIQINLLLPFGPDPSFPAYEGIQEKYDSKAHPLHTHQDQRTNPSSKNSMMANSRLTLQCQALTDHFGFKRQITKYEDSFHQQPSKRSTNVTNFTIDTPTPLITHSESKKSSTQTIRRHVEYAAPSVETRSIILEIPSPRSQKPSSCLRTNSQSLQIAGEVSMRNTILSISRISTLAASLTGRNTSESVLST